jgi:hypothetical protein
MVAAVFMGRALQQGGTPVLLRGLPRMSPLTELARFARQKSSAMSKWVGRLAREICGKRLLAVFPRRATTLSPNKGVLARKKRSANSRLAVRLAHEWSAKRLLGDFLRRAWTPFSK